MIYYFSGTGNSKFVAESLGRLLHEEIFFISKENPEEQTFEGDSLGFVFPVYSWGIPPLVDKFIKELPEKFSIKVDNDNIYIWAVLVCGDETGLAPDMIKQALGKKNLKLQGIWSIIMPNNYVLLPGFDVDSQAIEKKKLEDAPGRLLRIADSIIHQQKCIDVVEGSFPGLKSRLIYPLFKKWGIFPKKWHFTPSCIGCGRCEKTCPLHNIKMTENRHPTWGNRCCSCLGCYHICPVHAVEYGKSTVKKGQYFFPLKN